jgi:putative phosphoribosyl transferase
MFKNRDHAGKVLGEKLAELELENPVIIAVPRGGVAVGYRVAKHLKTTLDVVALRKLPIPFNPEAGFGAVTSDGSVVFNQPLLERIGLTNVEIKGIVSKVLEEVKRREELYRPGKKGYALEGKTAIIVDDGLASGFTVLAAIRHLRKFNPKRLIVAVPTSSISAYELVSAEADVFTLIKSHEPIFAVASFYDDFSDLTDKEVIRLLRKSM